MTREEFIKLPVGFYHAFLGRYNSFGIIDVKETPNGYKNYYFYSNNEYFRGGGEPIKPYKYSWFVYSTDGAWHFSEPEILSLKLSWLGVLY